MTVVVTGAAGHIGGVLVRELLAQGRAVRVLIHKDARAIEGLPVERISGDIRDLGLLRRIFQGAEVVYHLAARISLTTHDAPLVRSINVLGTRTVCQAALSSGVRRLVHFSSIHAFDDRPRHLPVDEERPPARGRGFPPYDRSKAEGEREVLEAVARGLDAVILNPTGVIGPLDFRISAMGQVFLDLYHRRLPALVEGGFDWVDVRDVVKSALSAETQGRTGERYLLPGRWVSVRDVARTVREVTGRETPRLVSPWWLARLGAPFIEAYARIFEKRPLFTSVSLRALRANRQISGKKASTELGHSPRPFRDSVEAIYDWFGEAGYLRA